MFLCRPLAKFGQKKSYFDTQLMTTYFTLFCIYYLKTIFKRRNEKSTNQKVCMPKIKTVLKQEVWANLFQIYSFGS